MTRSTIEVQMLILAELSKDDSPLRVSHLVERTHGDNRRIVKALPQLERIGAVAHEREGYSIRGKGIAILNKWKDLMSEFNGGISP